MTDRQACVVPASGLPAWAVPDASSTIVAQLEPGTPVQLIERLGDWGRVACPNGVSLWTDASRLAPAHEAISTTQRSSVARAPNWWRSRRVRLVVSLMLCVASPLIYLLGS